MANLYIRYFDVPTGCEPGTVLSLGFMTAKAFERQRVQEFLLAHAIVTETLEREAFVFRDDQGLSPSEVEVILRPPLTTELMPKFGRIIAHAAGAKDDWVNVADCTGPNANLDFPYVAQA